ncbi:MAG: hypothetical protein J0L92_19235 [Deltaproteobacteria bacterium]|nr:hypothetical protein [Deltaproteobacteria bacterium]
MSRTSRVWIVCAVVSALASSCTCGAPRQPPRDPTTTLPHGVATNLDFVVDWSTELPFVDLMRTSRPWISGTIEAWEGGPPIALDAHGWPARLEDGQIARTLLAWDITAHASGQYVVLWDGEGDVELRAGTIGPLEEAGRIVERSPGRIVFRLNPSLDGPGIIVNLVRSSAEQPLTNLRVIVPGGSCEDDASRFCDAEHACEQSGRCVPFEESHATRRFHPSFVRSMREYAVIRFMNWADANSTHAILLAPSRVYESRWEDRVTLEDARWWGRVPLEVMIDLANEAHVEPWLTLPSRADDDFARRAGELVRERLDPSLRVWVEYSNEVWNAQFPQNAYAIERGRALGLVGEGEGDDEAVLRFYARRSGELHRLFAEGLGDDPARPTRMVRVYAGQSVSTWRSEQILDFEDAYTRADVLAIAPYFGHPVPPEEYASWRAMGLDTFFAQAEASDLGPARDAIHQQARIARERGLALVAYEGGQHYVAQGDEQITALLGRAARDPRMEHLYDRYLQAFEAEGGRLMVHMVDCTAGGRDGFWGATERLGQPIDETPKLRALRSAAVRTRR